MLAVAAHMLDGEPAYRKGNHNGAFADRRTAVLLCDTLHFSEPWPWRHPPRYALGTLVLTQQCYEEVEQAYHADLGLDEVLTPEPCDLLLYSVGGCLIE